MCTVTFTCITTPGILAIGTPVTGSNGAEPNILFIERSHETSAIFAGSGRYFDGSILFYTP
jgi:hypothetical protein